MSSPFKDKSTALTCKTWQRLPESWRCPGCNRSRYQVFDEYQSKPGSTGMWTLIHQHHDHALDGLADLKSTLGISPHHQNLEVSIGSFPATYVCHKCNGWENSHLKMHTVRAIDPDLEDVTSFSPADIRNYTRHFSEADRSTADQFAKKRYLEIKLTKLRLVSMFEHIIAPNMEDEFDRVARESLATVSMEGLYPFGLNPKRDYVFSFGELDGAIKLHTWQIGAVKFHDERILRNIRGCETLVDFHKSCADDDVQVIYDICENGALRCMDFSVDGIKVDRTDVTPISLALMGVRYKKSEHWDLLSDLQERDEEALA